MCVKLLSGHMGPTRTDRFLPGACNMTQVGVSVLTVSEQLARSFDETSFIVACANCVLKVNANEVFPDQKDNYIKAEFLFIYLFCSPALTACLHDLARQVPQLKKNIEGTCNHRIFQKKKIYIYTKHHLVVPA